MTAAYQPIDRDSLKAELEILEQSRYNDYLFLARKDRFRLMALSEAYIVGSDANRFLALFEVQTCWPILAMLLHVEYMLILVALIKGAERIAKEMFGL